MITSVRIQNFRSYKDEAFEFEEGVNIIIGPNGSGKTNLLESLLVACRGGSYRSKDSDLISYDKEWARTDLYTITNEHRVVKLEQKLERVIKTFEIDEKIIKRFTHQNSLPIVLFEPNQLQLLTTSPDQRRLFTDDLLEQTDPLFAQEKRNYTRTLAQRNRLLKQNPSTVKNQIFAWNIRLSEIGERIAVKRAELIEKFNPDLLVSYQSIAKTKDKLQLDYISKHQLKNYASSLLHKLESNLEKEMLQGYTLYGPHRDDVLITLNGHPIQTSASRGEVRTILLSLKVQETKLVTQSREHKPMLLLDDVFGELDGARRKALTDFLSEYQTFITTTDADVVLKNFKHMNAIALK